MMGADDVVVEAAVVADGWLTAQMSGDFPPNWVERQTTQWQMEDDRDAMWQLILLLCRRITAQDNDTLELVGTGPLWELVHTWPDAALTLLEEEAPSNPRLRIALAVVMTDNRGATERIAAILAANPPGPRPAG
jgi:hypothetical protein